MRQNRLDGFGEGILEKQKQKKREQYHRNYMQDKGLTSPFLYPKTCLVFTNRAEYDMLRFILSKHAIAPNNGSLATVFKWDDTLSVF